MFTGNHNQMKCFAVWGLTHGIHSAQLCFFIDPSQIKWRPHTDSYVSAQLEEWVSLKSVCDPGCQLAGKLFLERSDPDHQPSAPFLWLSSCVFMILILYMMTNMLSRAWWQRWYFRVSFIKIRTGSYFLYSLTFSLTYKATYKSWLEFECWNQPSSHRWLATPGAWNEVWRNLR